MPKKNLQLLTATMKENGPLPNQPEDSPCPPQVESTAAQDITRTPPTQIPSGGPEEDTRFLKPDALPDRLDAGQQIGPYRLVRKLGQGGMGIVYQAYDENLDRKVAVKVMTERLAGDATARERMKIEAQSAARLNHPNIVSVYAFGNHKGSMYIAFEFIEGRDLGALIHGEGPLPAGQALEILRQAAEALRYAWASHVIHRDIKPANLMVTQNGQIKVADFGLAKRLDVDLGLTATDMILGSPNYMAPEQSSKNEADFRTDIYSLGCTLYMMLTGEAPYKASTPFGVILAHSQSPLPEPAELQDVLGGRMLQFLHRMMAKEPEDRFASYEELLAEIDELIALEQGPQPAATAARSANSAMPPLRVPEVPTGYTEATPPRRGVRSRKLLLLVALGISLLGVAAFLAVGQFTMPRVVDSGELQAATPAQAASPSPAARPLADMAEQLIERKDFIERAALLGHDVVQGQWSRALHGIEKAEGSPRETEADRQAVEAMKAAIVMARDRELALLESSPSLEPFEVQMSNRVVRIDQVSRQGIRLAADHGSEGRFVEIAEVPPDLRGRIARHAILKMPASRPEEHFANALLLKAISETDRGLQWSDFESTLRESPRLQEWKAAWDDWERLTNLGRMQDPLANRPAIRRPGVRPLPPRQ